MLASGKGLCSCIGKERHQCWSLIMTHGNCARQAYWIAYWQHALSLSTCQDPEVADKCLLLLDSLSIHCLLLMLKDHVCGFSQRCMTGQFLTAMLTCKDATDGFGLQCMGKASDLSAGPSSLGHTYCREDHICDTAVSWRSHSKYASLNRQW